jgi:hypothetical protein
MGMRFTNFCELMAVTFERSVWDTTIVPTLRDADTGWGLDFIWPFLLGFPRTKVAIVDAVCTYHAAEQKKPSVYSVHRQRNE